MALAVLKIVAAAVLGYAALCALLFVFQRSLIYLPQPRSFDAAGEPLRLAVDGAEVLVTTRARPGPGALLYFGGNAEDVSHNLPSLSATFPDRALYLPHYRGYGGSSGSPSEAALVADALALFDRVHAQHADVLVVGRSLGSGVAVQLAAQRPVARLVLVTPYDSIETIAVRHYGWFPVRWLLRDRFDSRRHAPQVSAPTLLIAAEDDEVVPPDSTRALLPAFRPGVARLAVLPGTGHNTLSAHPDYPALLQGR
jgi:pimeloyl-ACP methyl ester carboxylesterase